MEVLSSTDKICTIPTGIKNDSILPVSGSFSLTTLVKLYVCPVEIPFSLPELIARRYIGKNLYDFFGVNIH